MCKMLPWVIHKGLARYQCPGTDFQVGGNHEWDRWWWLVLTDGAGEGIPGGRSHCHGVGGAPCMDWVLALAQCLWGVASPRAVSSLSGVPSWQRVCFAPWGALWVGGGLSGRGVTGAGALPLLVEAKSTTHPVPHKRTVLSTVLMAF